MPMKLRQLGLGLLAPLVWMGCASGGQPDVRLPSTERTGWVAVPQREFPEICVAVREESGIALGISVSRSSLEPVSVHLVSLIGRFTEPVTPVGYLASSNLDIVTRRVAWTLADDEAQLMLGAGDSMSVKTTLMDMLRGHNWMIQATIEGRQFNRTYVLRGLGSALNAAGCRMASWVGNW